MKKKVVVVNEHRGISPYAKSVFAEMMEEAGFSDDDFRWVNVLDEPPPEGKNVTKTMVKNSLPHFKKKFEKRDPSFTVLLGNTPCNAVLDLNGIKKLRGKPVEKDGVVCMPTYHPNMVLHDDKWRDMVVRDLKNLKECIRFGGIPEEKELDYVIVDTWDKVKAMLKDMKGWVAVDLETTRLYPFYTTLDERVESGNAPPAVIKEHKATHNGNLPAVVAMQFGCKKRQWVVPMETAGIWSKKELKEIVKLATLRLKRFCKSIFHNGKFDALWMRVRFGVKWNVDFDTMLAHFLLDENDRHGLKYLAQKYLGVPDWDVDGKEKTAWSPQNAKYAAHDVFYTRRLRPIFAKMLKEDWDVKQVFDWVMMPCVKLFIEAEFSGVHIDLDKMDDAENYLREEQATALANLEKWGKKATKVDKKTGKINWGSADQLGHLLFKDLKIKSVEKTKGGKDSVSESVLLRIDHPMVGDLLKFRAAQKQLSSFIEGWKPYLDLAGRLHPVFKLHGTVTGRLSCEHPNLQQVPRDPRIRSLITAPPGWVLVEMDLSQIELRIAAELADEHNLLRVFREGGDPHWETAIREIERGAGYKKEINRTIKYHHKIEGKEYTRMSYSDAVEYILKLGGKACEGLVDLWEQEFPGVEFMNWKETRKKAKAINFGYLYGMWWKKFKIYARDNYGVDVTDEQAQASREAFFDLYGAFPKWHEKQRRFAKMHGYVKSLSGRKRRLPAAMGHRDTPEQREAQRQAINSPVQSFANELNLMAALQMREEFSWNWFRICGTVHDAILMWVREDKVEFVHNRGLEIMSSPNLLTDFDISLSVPIEADAKVGAWGQGKDLKKWLLARAQNDNEKSATETKRKKKRAA